MADPDAPDPAPRSRAPAKPRVVPRVVDWIFTVPFLLAFGLILLVFDPIQRVARLFGQRPQEIAAGALQWSLVQAIRLAGVRFEVERSPAVERGAAYLIIANHQSMFDIPIVGALLFSNFPKYVSKRELARRIPSISYNLRAGGHALIDRDDRSQATDAIRQLGRVVCERGVSALIYPEGTRSREGSLRPFRRAGALALFEAAPEVPVLPVAIDESWRLLRFNLTPVPFGTRVRVKIGAPIPRSKDEDRAALLEEARTEIARTLERWRAREERP